ncbi:EVE domain-containing protein [Methyloceanibacter sp.]|jgi:predicted RNA-binding protein with PUA-like domain|uniref:EVE domain-containing protein n=1 Tax=Methyloceanibacter sp. TaxID=1965321 RepID=UPI003566C2F7
MAYWLMKSEPGTWSWEQQKNEGKKGAEWDGVRNYQARNNMRAMKKGDFAFFYHSIGEKACVGIVKVVVEAHPDSTDTTGKWECVDVAAVADLPSPVTLADIKDTPQLENMVLVKNSRLSVQPVTAAEWKKVCALGGLKDPPTA